ncbi:hypothetical protein J2S76_004204 [Ancylobacter vacuolatus]|uniref:Uncharacterized protein n=1 Tax=Ancylobacter vacuolatus TaxID=223389 RepID=A0ABU0DN80_9HYPH|nr:hypothetical protein [Ancylobacter vacuolatus]
MIANVADHVAVAAILGRQQVNRPNVVSESGEGPADNTGRLAADKDAQRGGVIV